MTSPGRSPESGSYGAFRYGREVDAELHDELYDDEPYDELYDDEFYDEPYDDEDHDPTPTGGDRPRGSNRSLVGSVTRRRFLAGLALTGAAGLAARRLLAGPGELAETAPPTTTTPDLIVPPAPTAPAPAQLLAVDALPGLLTPAPVDQRILVLIELEGGNDGPSTVVPAGTGTYYDLRPRLAIAPESVLGLDDDIGLNPNLARLYLRQKAVVEGVGPVDGNLSHFDMASRWEAGDATGLNHPRSGFLARLADAVDKGDAATVGLSVSGFTARFHNASAATLAIEQLNQLDVLINDKWIYPSYRRALTRFSGGPLTSALVSSWDRLVEIGSALPGGMGDIEKDSAMVTDGGELGRGLAAAAELIKADIGIRVIHARLPGFDTHEGHEWRHEHLMQQFDVAVDGFLAKMHEYGLADRVLVASSSEFGRRLRQNGSGFDHGVASTMLLFGPVVPGRYGQAPSLKDLDRDGNLRTTVPFDDYLGTLAQSWLGVDATSVLPSVSETLPIV